MVGPIRSRGLISALLTLAALGGTSARAQESVRLSQNLPGDAKPVVLTADEIYAWGEGKQRVFLLRGQALVEHGVLHARFRQGVVWVDTEQYQSTRVWHVDLYMDGEVRVTNGAKEQAGANGLLDLHTRGELKVKGKVKQEAQDQDPLYRQASAERRGKNATPAAGPTPAGGKAPPAGPVQRVSYPDARDAQGPADKPPPTPIDRAPPPPAHDPTPQMQLPPGPAPAPRAPSGPGIAPAQPAPTPPGPARPARVLPGPPAAGPAPLRYFSITQRTAAPFQQQTVTLPDGKQALVLTGGIILTVRNVERVGILDVEADKLVLWTPGNTQQFLSDLNSDRGQASRELEFYLAGNVEIREQSGKESRVLRADEVYYDVGRNVAVAKNADLEVREPGLLLPLHLKAEEVDQVSPTQFHAAKAEVFSSRLPSDPGLKVYVAEADLETKRVPKRSIFGRQFVSRQTGQPEFEEQRLVYGRNVFLEAKDVPVFYLPFIQGDANDPLGPLEDVNFGSSRVYGFRTGLTFNVYDLLGVDPLPGTRWHFETDYLSRRGPALGTDFQYAGDSLLGIPNRYTGVAKAWGLYDDQNGDILGGGRGENVRHPYWRGRVLWRQNVQELPYDFTLQTQLALLSDKNFLEQFYKLEFDQDVNQETFLFLKQQWDNRAWTALVKPRLRPFVTETEWLPRLDGYLIGETFLNWFSYTTNASVGYAQLQTTDVGPFAYLPTDRDVNTGRVHWRQELGLPFYLGPVKTVPYGVLDLAGYTEDLKGSDGGRVLGGGGVRASIPFTRVYPDVESTFFNVNGINHKIVLSANYYWVESSDPFNRFPQLDRLNDDASDQALREIRPFQTTFNPAHGAFLVSSPLFDPQIYAIRRLVDTRADTMDSINVLQVDLRQRWQTKRGYPGQQHVVDWMTLDLSGSYFPHADRDNFGNAFAFLEYDWTWNIGDRTSLVSTGWIDPIDDGPRVFTVGALVNRPDRTSFYVGYREIDPVNSRAVAGSVSYVLSPKYALTALSVYDFGTKESLSNSLVVTRMGTDLQVSLGVTYNSLQNNFGLAFEIVPNVAAPYRRTGGIYGLQTASLLR